MSERLGAIEALGAALDNTAGHEAEAIKVLEQGRDVAAREGRQDFVARFWGRLGEHYYEHGELEKARAAQDASLAALDTHLGEAPVPTPSLERAEALSNRAQLLFETGRPERALADQQKAIDILEGLEKGAPTDNKILLSLAQTLTRHADAQYAATDNWDASIPEYRRAIDVFERAHASDPSRIDYARNLSIALERYGGVMLQTGDLPRARDAYDRMTALRRTRLARDPDGAEARRDLAVALEHQGDLARAEKDIDRALARYDEALGLNPKDAPSNSVDAHDLAMLWYKTGTARAAAKPQKPWRDAFDKAIALMAPLLDQPERPPGWLSDMAAFRYDFGGALEAAGRTSEARAQWTAALDLIDRQTAIAKEANQDTTRLVRDREVLLRRLKKIQPKT
jgi:tetratricopeptide (TPR) repeat protein